MTKLSQAVLSTASLALELLAPATGAANQTENKLPHAQISGNTPAQLFPLSSVRLLPSPFTAAAEADQKYSLDPTGAKAANLEVTYSGDDWGRTFEICANDVLIARHELKGERRGRFFEVRYPLSAASIAASKDGHVIVRFVWRGTLAGSVYDIRLLRVPLEMK